MAAVPCAMNASGKRSYLQADAAVKIVPNAGFNGPKCVLRWPSPMRQVS